MQIQHAITLLRDTCALHHLALKTEKSYTHWLLRYVAFLKLPQTKPLQTSEEKIEAFLTSLSLSQHLS